MGDTKHPLHHKFLRALFSDLTEAAGMLREAPELISSKDGCDETALHYLAIENHVEGVEFLIVHGADVNEPDDFGDTPLISAASQGHGAIVSILIKHGAKLNSATTNGDTALHEAASDGLVEVMKQLLVAGANLEAEDGMGMTPLHEAADHGHLEAAQLLVDAGANVRAEDCGGMEPIHNACASASIPIVDLLLSHGADINAQGCFGLPLNMLRKDSMEFLQFMLSKGARLDGKSEDGRTLLHGAAYSGLMDVVNFLLQNGFDPATLNAHGGTAIDEAVRGDKTAMADFLRNYISK